MVNYKLKLQLSDRKLAPFVSRPILSHHLPNTKGWSGQATRHTIRQSNPLHAPRHPVPHYEAGSTRINQ